MTLGPNVDLPDELVADHETGECMFSSHNITSGFLVCPDLGQLKVVGH